MEINLQSITRTFGDFAALRKIHLEVRSGELLALLGPSGSGKTTLLRIIAGMETPDADSDGRVSFDGEDVTRRKSGERGVGFVFQHYALFKHLTVFENVAFGLRARPRRQRPSQAEIAARVRELLGLVQMEGLELRFPAQLSGGQRQRIALARALAVEPRVLLLDEPFGALDAQVRKDLRRWLRQLHQEIHVTSIFVTHDQEEALELADRVVIMNAGRIEQIGTPGEVYESPATPFVLRFLGTVNPFPALANGPFSPAANEVFVRPHEITVDVHPPSESSIKGRVERIQLIGPIVRIEVRSAAREAPIEIELSRERHGELKLATGQTVYLRARRHLAFPSPPPLRTPALSPA